MKEIEIKFEGLKVKHLLSIANINENNTIKEKVDILSHVYNIPKPQLYRISVKDVDMLWQTLLTHMQEVANAELRKIIEVNGKKYKLIDINKLSVGWVIDYTELAKDGINPEDIMALCYIDADLADYHDDNNDLLKRKEVMLEADLADYIALSKFFFRHLERISQALNRLATLEELRKKPFKTLLRLGFGL